MNDNSSFSIERDEPDTDYFGDFQCGDAFECHADLCTCARRDVLDAMNRREEFHLSGMMSDLTLEGMSIIRPVWDDVAWLWFKTFGLAGF